MTLKEISLNMLSSNLNEFSFCNINDDSNFKRSFRCLSKCKDIPASNAIKYL